MYTFAELGNWVHLLAKRAEHRNDFAKYEDDLAQANNYLNTMRSKLDSMRDPINLEKFSDTILCELSAANPKIRLSHVTTDNVLYVSWKILDNELPRSFQYMYRLHVEPSLISLAQGLKNIDEVFVLNAEPNLGKRVSIIQSDNMSARLTTWYDSDNGSGNREKTGTMMSIEVGVAE